MLHHPPYVYLDDTWYIFTASIYQKQRLLQAEKCKQLVICSLDKLASEFDYYLYAWVILDNHYHILVKVSEGKQIPLFFSRLHGWISR